MRILLADNDYNFGYVLKTELEDNNFIVDHVTDGLDAIISFIKHEYEIILLEINLPNVGGIEVLKIFNVLMKCKNINSTSKIITFSCENGKKKDEMINLGAIKYLKKPFIINSLLVWIRSVVDVECIKS